MSWWAPWTMPAGRSTAAARQGDPPSLADSALRACLSEGRARREVRNLDWGELLAEWNLTRPALLGARTPAAVLALVNLRAAIVEELDRRDPRAFSTWFAVEQRRIGLGR